MCRFLRQCSNLKIFPPTIDNLHLPPAFNTSYLETAKQKIKRYILNKIKRQLRDEIAANYREQACLDQQLLSHATESLIRNIHRNRYLVYNTTSKLQSERLNKKSQRLTQTKPHTKVTTETTNPYDKTKLVTNLSSNITQDELNLLSKRPKFNIQTDINDQTLTDLSLGFYRLSNHLRWQQVRPETSNQHLFKYP